jgi:hypothetical protein
VTRRRREGGQRGQAAVEVALALPLVALLVLGIVQVGLVVRDQVLVTHAAREAARAAAVDPAPGAARAAARRSSGLRPDRLSVAVGHRARTGQPVTVRVRYRTPTNVPLIGTLLGDITLSGTAAMRIEQ